MSPLARTLEALLFLSPEPVALADLAQAADVWPDEAEAALAELGEAYAPGARGLVLRELAGGWTLATAPEAEAAARRLLAKPRTPPLTPAQAETLAIVAYLQPVSRPEITRIRGVSADSAAATLLERGLIEEAGRSQFGAVLYRTTAAVPEAVRPGRARGPARPGAVGPEARGGGRAARPPAQGRRAARRGRARAEPLLSGLRGATARGYDPLMAQVAPRPGAHAESADDPVPDGVAQPRDGRPRAHHGGAAVLLAAGALGVVFGDIGTSPLYALQATFTEAVTPDRAGVYGVISLVFWAITLIVSIKYVTFIMRADNEGEGGIMALIARVQTVKLGGRWAKMALIALGIFGASLFYGDGMITPAISVLSAVEGLKVAAPRARVARRRDHARDHHGAVPRSSASAPAPSAACSGRSWRCGSRSSPSRAPPRSPSTPASCARSRRPTA